MPVTQIHSYVPSAVQAAFHADPAKMRLCRGAYRSGKTEAMLWELIGMSMRTVNASGAGALFGVFRKWGPSLTDSTQRQFLEGIPDELIVPGSIRKEQGRSECTLVGGTRVLFRAIDDSKKLGGTSFDAIFVDEAWELTLADFEMLRSRLSGRLGPRRMVLATNPPTRNHWLYKLFGDPVTRPQGYTEHHFRMVDNAAYLSADYLAEYEATKETDPQKYQRYVLGEWGFTSDNAPVFPDFREGLHTVPLEPRRHAGSFLVQGFDFGYHHPFAGWGQILPSGHCQIYREVRGENEDIRAFGLRTLQQQNLHYPGWDVLTFCDPAGKAMNDVGTSSVRELRKLGIAPRYRKLKIMASVQALRTLMREVRLGVPMLRVDPRYCPTIVEAFLGGYTMDPKTDMPLKDGYYDHGMDMVRYMLAPALMGPGNLTKPMAPLTTARARVAV